MSWISDLNEGLSAMGRMVGDAMEAASAIKPRLKSANKPRSSDYDPGPSASTKKEMPQPFKKKFTPLPTKPQPNNYHLRQELLDRLGNISPIASTPLQLRLQLERANNLTALQQHMTNQNKMLNLDLTRRASLDQEEHRHNNNKSHRLGNRRNH